MLLSLIDDVNSAITSCDSMLNDKLVMYIYMHLSICTKAPEILHSNTFRGNTIHVLEI